MANPDPAGDQLDQIIHDLEDHLMADNEVGDALAIAQNGPLFNQILQDLEQGQAVINAQVEGQGNFDLGIQHLTSLEEPVLRNVINQNLELPLFNHEQQITVFQRLTKSLVEEGGSSNSRPTIYANLTVACNNEVNPETVAALGQDALVNLRVGGQQKAQAILQFAQSFQDPNEIDQLIQLDSEAMFGRFKAIPGIGGYRALYMLVFGMRRLDYMPLPELTLREKLRRLYGNQQPDYETWNPYKGLASWFVWKYVSKW